MNDAVEQAPKVVPAPWTPTEDAMLRELWATGMSCTNISLRIGKTKSAITGRAHRQGLPPRPSPIKGKTVYRNPEREETQRLSVMRVYEEGIVDASVISARLGIARGRVVNALNKSGIKLGRTATVKSQRGADIKLAGSKNPDEPVAPPMKMPVYDVDPATLVAGVGGSRRHCQFIPHDPRGERTLYCGKPPATGFAYCDGHMRVCYRPHALQVARQGAAE